MEGHPLGQAVSDCRFTTTNLSTGSLDICQVTANIALSSILSESVTFASLSSKSSGCIPAFASDAKYAVVSTVALGEDLKMFCTTEPADESPEISFESRVLLAAPTKPRLRTMCKECLCIDKWAKYSTSWKAPGHIPWEGAQETGSTVWVPEGSLFSPDVFSRSLSRARRSDADADGISQAGERIGTLRRPEDCLDSELEKMVDELKGLRTYFEVTPGDKDPLADVAPKHLPIPSLVISNSHVTLPLPMDSSQSLAPPLIAKRRGKEAPPPLFLQKSSPIADIPYPDIPTAFLCSSASPNEQDSRCDDNDLERGGEEKPTMRVEDMISNLRRKCLSLTMSLPNSPVDAVWNSRSAKGVACERVASPERRQIAKPPKDPIPLSGEILQRENPTSPEKKAFGSASPSRKRVNSRIPSLPMPLIRKSTTSNVRGHGAPKAVPPSTKHSSNSRPLPPLAPSEAVGRPKKVCKTVRFALSEQELQGESALSKVQINMKHKKGQIIRRHSDGETQKRGAISTQTPNKPSFGQSLGRAATMSRVKLRTQETPSSAPLSKSPAKQCTHSISAVPSPRQTIFSSKAPGDTDTSGRSATGSSPLMRRSLSRIIKGPMQVLKENRRATISTPEVKRTEIPTTAKEAKDVKIKSRLPTPLRSILTRFR